MGLIGMEERTHLYDGEFTLHSAPGQGTAVRAVWPAEETAP
jgi:signal transduction histidine kinase